MTITRLTGGLTPGDGADPRTFPAIFNATADEIDAQGTAIADLEDLNPVQFGTAVASGGQVLAYSTAVSGYNPADVFGAAVNGTAVYRFVSTLYFTSNGTFSKADYPWLRAIRVKVQGAGGGGGGCATTSATQVALGPAGASGAYCESFITNIAGLDSSVTVTRGAGGAGGTAGANAGATGGTSSFGALLSSAGGAAGFGGFGDAAVPFRIIPGGVGAAVPGTGDLAIGGGDGAVSFGIDINNVFAGPTYGAGPLGGNGRGKSSFQSGANGDAGRNYGGGGQGGINARSQVTARSGGAGADGIVIVELYA
jgi:hypothetical protein